MNRCEICKWYKLSNYDEENNECENPEVGKLIWADNADGMADVYILPNFGCIFWEKQGVKMSVHVKEDLLKAILENHFPELCCLPLHDGGDPNVANTYHNLRSCFSIDLAQEIVSFGLVKKRILKMLQDELKFIQQTIQKVEEITEEGDGCRIDSRQSFNGSEGRL